MLEEVNQIQAGDTQATTQPGAEVPQVAVVPADVQPEAGSEPQKPVRTYTQKEWTEREVARDQEVAQYRQGMAQIAMQAQIREAQAAEALAQDSDAKAVDAGEMTQTVAQQRQQQRYASLQRQFEAQQQQEAIQGQLATAQKVLIMGEAVGRALAAQNLAKEYGLQPAELLDKSITTFDQMEKTAAKLALRKAQGGETFDSSHMGSTGSNVDKMTPEEMISYGLRLERTKGTRR